jgi:hypothetical protein
MYENINEKAEYLIDLWYNLTFGIFGSKYFLFFVLIFPLIIALLYLGFYMGGKILPFNYSIFYYLKESVIFFSFLYFFLFVLILIDFIYYLEMRKVFFMMDLEQFINILNFKK